MNIWPWSRIRALEQLNEIQARDIKALNTRLGIVLRTSAERLASTMRLQSALDAKQTRLERIAELETPRCASIGRRMAKIARGEA